MALSLSHFRVERNPEYRPIISVKLFSFFIIDKNARIGDEVKLVNPKNTASESADNYAIVNGIVVVHKNAVIPDGTVI